MSDYTKNFQSQEEYFHPDRYTSGRYHMTDTSVFYKEKQETYDMFLTRVFNTLMIINRPVNETRINFDFNDNSKNANWIAVDFINLSDE